MTERAWVVTVKGFPDIRAQVFATTRAKAIYDQWWKARDAGYKVKWTDFKAVIDYVWPIPWV